MPQMGVSVAEGTIVEWLKRPGDWVESDEIVCVVTTDKVDVEIPSPGAGRLERILVEPGETVAVGTAAGRDRRRSHARRGPSRGGDRRRERRHGRTRLRGCGAGPVALLLARRAPHRGGARRRPRAGRGPRCRRADQEERPARLHRGRRDRRRPPIRVGRCTASRPTCRTRAAGPAPSRLPVGARPGCAGRRAPRADDPDAPGDRPAHGREPPDLGALHDDHRGGPRRRRRGACGAPGPDGGARRRPHLPGLRGRGDGGGAAAPPDPERVDRGGRDRPPRRREPGDRGRARDRADRPRDRAAPSASTSRGWPRRSRTWRRGPAPASSRPTRSAAARSRSPTRAGSARCSRPRSSTSRRWRSSTSRRSSSGPSSSKAGTAASDSIAIRPMTNLCMSWDHRALDGVEAARFLGEIKDSLEGWRAER